MKRTKNSIFLYKAGRGSVGMIASLLVASAVLRVVSGVAVAQDIEAKPLPDAVQLTEENRMQEHTIAEATQATRPEKMRLLDALQQREARVTARERQLDMRAKALAVADEEISKRLTDLEEAETTLRQTLTLADGAAEDDLARLTTVYESMKPKDAAALFQTMEPGFAAGFLSRMRPDVAAAVMTGLPPDIAYSISVIMAGRNANVPKS